MEKLTQSLSEKIAHIFESNGFNVLLLVVFLLLFCWPYIAPAQDASVGWPFYIEFVWWLALIVLLTISNVAMSGRDDTNHT
jgi:hypothetical protein